MSAVPFPGGDAFGGGGFDFTSSSEARSFAYQNSDFIIQGAPASTGGLASALPLVALAVVAVLAIRGR